MSQHLSHSDSDMAASHTTPAAEIPHGIIPQETLEHHLNLAPLAIQCSLTVGAPDDPLEDEADQMADRVMRMPEPGFIQRKCADCEEEQVQRKPLSSFIQRASATAGTQVNSNTASRISSARGGGIQLPGETKSFMESRFGNSFSHVRIHDGGEATTLSQDLRAQAFTVGNDVFFNSGKFAPETTDGKRLLAHELTHVVQQNGAHNKKIQKRDLGPYRESTGMFSTVDITNVRSRSVTDWQVFLRNEAYTTEGAGELMAFMAMALGTSITRHPWHKPSRVKTTESEALDLVEALLTTGSGIDFDEDQALVVGLADFPVFGRLLLEQMSRQFLGKTIQRMTSQGGKTNRLDSTYQTQVSAFVQESNLWGGGIEVVGNAVIDASLGAAVAAAIEYVHIGSDAYLTRTENGNRILTDAELRDFQNKKNELDIMVHNSASTIAGVISAYNSLAARQAAMRDAIIGVAGSLLPALINFKLAEAARLAIGGGTTGKAQATEEQRYAIQALTVADSALISAAGSLSSKVASAALNTKSSVSTKAVEGFIVAVDDIRREMRNGPNPQAVDTGAGQALIGTFRGPLSKLM